MSKERAYPSTIADQFLVRLPDGLKQAIMEAALSNGRSMNAEFVHRLRQSFQSIEPTADFPEEVVMAVQDEMEARGGTFTEALTRLILIAQAQGGTLFFAKIAPGVSPTELREAIRASETVIPADAGIVVVRTPNCRDSGS